MWVIRCQQPLLVFPILLIFLILADTARGCTCLPPPTVLDEFARSENVLVARLLEFREIDRRVDGTNVYRTYAAIMEVEKVYKGNLRKNQTIKVFNGSGGDCTAGFERNDIGESFLFYIGSPRSIGKYPTPLYIVGVCSRSTNLKNAAPDLKYLDNRRAREGETRLSGKIAASGDNVSLPSVAGLTVKIVGPDLQSELKTDEDGFFEIWDLPPGIYNVSFQLPLGWKMSRSRIIPSVKYSRWTETSQNFLSVSIVPKKHTEVTTFLKIDNEISGKVISPEGNPMKGVCVSAYWLTPTSDSYMIPANCTNEKGEFKILQLPPGKYRIEVNNRGNITASNPFETFYYPGVENKEHAEPVLVKEGVSVRNLVIRVAKTFPLIEISGQLTFKDGEPVVEEDVRFDPHDDTKYEKVEVETDESGKFRFEIPLGAKGELKANTNIWVSRFEKCTQALTLRKTRTGRAADIQSNVVEIDARVQQENVRLLYPLTCR